jgi:hypothetical protein
MTTLVEKILSVIFILGVIVLLVGVMLSGISMFLENTSYWDLAEQLAPVSEMGILGGAYIIGIDIIIFLILLAIEIITEKEEDKNAKKRKT